MGTTSRKACCGLHTSTKSLFRREEEENQAYEGDNPSSFKVPRPLPLIHACYFNIVHEASRSAWFVPGMSIGFLEEVFRVVTGQWHWCSSPWTRGEAEVWPNSWTSSDVDTAGHMAEFRSICSWIKRVDNDRGSCFAVNNGRRTGKDACKSYAELIVYSEWY